MRKTTRHEKNGQKAGKSQQKATEIKGKPTPAIPVASKKTQAAILRHFKVWSGGHSPQECSNEELGSYIDTAILAEHNTPAITSWLESLNKV